LYFTSKAWLEFFDKFGKGAKNKFIPGWVLEYRKIYLKKLFEGLMDSDGYWRNLTYSTVSKRLKDSICELGIKIGLIPNVSKRYSESIFENRIIKGWSYFINFGRMKKITNKFISKKQYKGKIWCITVKNKNFLIERNGRFVFSGNTDEVFGPAPFGVDYKEGDVYNPSNPYSASKEGQEAISKAFAFSFGLPIMITRTMNCIPAEEFMEVLLDGYPTRISTKEVYENWKAGKEIKALSLKNKKLVYRKIIFGKKEIGKKKMISIKTRYGRKFRATADHGLIYFDKGKFRTKRAEEIEVGEKLPIWARVPELKLQKSDYYLDVIDILKGEKEKIKVVIKDEKILEKVRPVIRKMVYNKELQQRKGCPSSVYYWIFRQCKRSNLIPLEIVEKTNPIGREISNFPITLRYKENSIPNRIELDSDFLWLLGLFLAEATIKEFKKGTFVCALESDLSNIEKASTILNRLAISYTRTEKPKTGAPQLIIHNQTFFHLLKELGFAKLSKEKEIPNWIKALSNRLLKHFIQGYWDGDGQTGNSKKELNWLSFDTSSRKLALDLTYILGRFGIIAALHETFHKPRKESQKKYLSYTIEGFCKCNREPQNWKSLQEGSYRSPYLKYNQRGDVILAKIKEKTIEDYNGEVYDFTIEDAHNFSLACGVIVHNCIGERQHPEKFIPKTVRAILNNEKVVIHGLPENISLRKWIHARNVCDALIFLMDKGEIIEKKFQNDPAHGIYHIVGEERNALELANRISKIIKGRELKLSEIKYVDFHRTRPGHDFRYSLSGEKLKSLGFKYKLSLEQSFDKTIKWMIAPENRRWINL